MALIRTSWSQDEAPANEAAGLPPGLTREEDDELRRLHWLAQVGTLAVKKVERLLELRLRDRRGEIRPPREFEERSERRTSAAPPESSDPEDSSDSVDVLTRVTNDLVEVRRQLEAMAQSRLRHPFSDEDREKYRELIELEYALLDPRHHRGRHPGHATSDPGRSVNPPTADDGPRPTPVRRDRAGAEG